MRFHDTRADEMFAARAWPAERTAIAEMRIGKLVFMAVPCFIDAY